MTKAYVETTVLTDALLKPGAKATAAQVAIGRYDASLLPVYSIKEFKAGPLRRYVWFHGKLVTTGSWEQTLTQLRRMAGSPYGHRWTSAAIEALEADAHENRSVTLGQLVEKYGTSATEDVVRCERYRLSLRRIIMRAWRRRRALTSEVLDELSCYPETNVTEEHRFIKLNGVDCSPDDECCLAKALRADPEALNLMLSAIKSQSPKLENQRRAQVLRDIIRLPNHKLTAKECQRLGDAVFAYFCPKDAVILTTNISDLGPLAQSVGKSVAAP